MRIVKRVMIILLTLAGTTLAQGRYGQPQLAPAPPTILQSVGIDQKIGDAVPSDIELRDENGRLVRVGDYLGDKPVVLVLVYYECPSLCNVILNSLVRALGAISLEPGKDFELLTVSFDPTETPALASQKKQVYLESYGREGAGAGWHFLTAEQPAIERLTDAVGFRYVYDERTQQYAHGSALIVLTPDGRISHYLYSIDQTPLSLRLAVADSSGGKVGSPVDTFLQLCFQYDPTRGRYGFAIIAMLRVAGVVTLLVLAGFIFFHVRRERCRRCAAPATGT